MDYRELIEQIDQLNREIKDESEFGQNEIEDIAERYSNKSSEFLAGVAGGVLGGSVGVTVSILAGISLITGPAGAVLGITLGILIWRGRGRHRLERATSKYQIAISVIREQIASLPSNTPNDVIGDLWEQYRELNKNYQRIAIGNLSDNSSKFNRLLDR